MRFQQLGEGGLVLRVCAAIQQMRILCQETHHHSPEWAGYLEMSIVEFDGPVVNDLIHNASIFDDVHVLQSCPEDTESTTRGKWVDGVLTVPISSFIEAEILLRAVRLLSEVIH